MVLFKALTIDKLIIDHVYLIMIKCGEPVSQTKFELMVMIFVNNQAGYRMVAINVCFIIRHVAFFFGDN